MIVQRMIIDDNRIIDMRRCYLLGELKGITRIKNRRVQ